MSCHCTGHCNRKLMLGGTLLLSGLILYRLRVWHGRSSRTIETKNIDVPADAGTKAEAAAAVEAHLTVTTFNVWKLDGVPIFWPQRRPALFDTILHLAPDVLLLQEVHPLLVRVALDALPGHEAIGQTPSEFKGWKEEGTIIYDKGKLDLIEYGAEDVGMQEELRRLFWARFRHKGTARTVLVATAHFSWQGHPTELATDVNVRRACARNTAALLPRLARENDGIIFGGDLNEGYWPWFHLKEAGFVDVFTATQQRRRHTHPAYPTGMLCEDECAEQVLDWMFSKGPLQTVSASVLRDVPRYGPDQLAASDHLPVSARFRFLSDSR